MVDELQPKRWRHGHGRERCSRSLHDRSPTGSCFATSIQQDQPRRCKPPAAWARIRFVETFDVAAKLFRIRGLEWSEVSSFLRIGLSDELVETALRLESLEQWVPFVADDRAVYQVSSQKRDAAFRAIVLANYGHTCAVTGQKFHSPRHVEADGAHIISKDVRGTDDPRNGIALSKSAHWAFDRGLFRISDQYEIVLHPKLSSAAIANFPAIELDGRRVLLPADPYYRPHPDALAWHKQEVFDRFEP